MSELKTAFATETNFKVSDDLEIKVNLLTLEGVSRIVGKIHNAFSKMDGIENPTVKHLLVAILEEEGLPHLIMELTTNLEKQQILDLNVAASIDILAKTVELNYDFFIQAAAPRLGKLAAILMVKSGDSFSNG